MSYQHFGHVDPEERLDYADEPAPAGGEEYYAPRRLMPGVLLMAGVMAVFAGGLWFAYHAGERHAENVAASIAPASAPSPGNVATNAQVPLIRADTDPVKVKPDKAGGMNIPDRNDPIYSMQQSTSPTEHILPPPEAPAPRPVAPPQVAGVPQTVAPSIQQGPTPLPAPGPSAVATARPTPKPEGAGPPMKIQLASLRTSDEARDEWARVKRENTNLLGKFTAVAVRADLGDRGIWYRVEVGPVGDRAAALQLCKALKERNLGCQIVP
jgi:sporulation related protein